MAMRSAALATFLLAATVSGQDRLDPMFLYERIWATVPVVGTGKAHDPFRLMFVPNPAAHLRQNAPKGKGPDRKTDILTFQVWFSDDGKTALVEFVAADRAAFASILSSRLPGVKVFERGKATKEEVEAEFRKYKPNFRIDNVTPGRAQ